MSANFRNYVVGVEHCFNWAAGTISLAADGFVVCSLVTSWLVTI